MSIDGANEAHGARSTGSAGAPPVAGKAGSAGGGGGAGNANVYPGTNVQLADLDAELVDPAQPQLRVEPDGDADRIFVATPDDDLAGPPPSLSASFIRRANRHAAAEMTGWGVFQDEGSGPEDPAWIVGPADPEVLAQYAKAFHAAPWG